MNLTEAIDAFFASQSGQLAVWVLLAPVLDFGLGVAASIRDNTFKLDSVAAFLRKHVAGRIIPIWSLLFLGYFAEGITLPVLDFPALTSLGVVAAGLYIAETIGSILGSWGPKTAPPVVGRDDLQPVPED